MTELLFKTKGGAQVQGRPRVYFTCHPADVDRSLEKLCAEIFDAADCAVFYTADMADRLPEETRETDLNRMNLFVIPVSLRLLTEPSRAMDEDFPFAKEKHIPVLPIVLEPGLEPIYSREDRFGSLQYLDPLAHDDTAVPYEEKLKKYLNDVLIDSKTADRVRKAFDAYVFLSYRKKDRKQANELMRLIHADPVCQRIAIWFDEYLTPGESFTESIKEAMEKSSLFALLVTPSLLELNAQGKANYVQSTEYPAARDAGMPLLPAEVTATDRTALKDAYDGLPTPLNVGTEAERERFLAQLRALAHEEEEDNPEHNYLLGLAYMDGIDVETDRDRGFALITSAAEAELPEAIRKLYTMYDEGVGVPVDWHEALKWAERLVEYCKRTLGESHSDTLAAVGALGKAYRKSGNYSMALKTQEEVYARCCELMGENDPFTLRSLGNLSAVYGSLGIYSKELHLLEKGYPIFAKVLGEEHPDTLRMISNLGSVNANMGQYHDALMYFQKAYDIQSKMLGEEHPDTLRSLVNLAKVHSRLGVEGKALELIKKAYAIYCHAYGEEHPYSLMAMGDLASSYYRLGENKKAFDLDEKVYSITYRVLGKAHPATLQALINLALSYSRMGDQEKGLEMLDTAYSTLYETLGESHPLTLIALSGIANAYKRIGFDTEALRQQERLYALRCKHLGEAHPDTLSTMRDLISTYKKLGNGEKARELQEKYDILRCRVWRSVSLDGTTWARDLVNVKSGQYVTFKTEVYNSSDADIDIALLFEEIPCGLKLRDNAITFNSAHTHGIEVNTSELTTHGLGITLKSKGLFQLITQAKVVAMDNTAPLVTRSTVLLNGYTVHDELKIIIESDISDKSE